MVGESRIGLSNVGMEWLQGRVLESIHEVLEKKLDNTFARFEYIFFLFKKSRPRKKFVLVFKIP